MVTQCVSACSRSLHDDEVTSLSQEVSIDWDEPLQPSHITSPVSTPVRQGSPLHQGEGGLECLNKTCPRHDVVIVLRPRPRRPLPVDATRQQTVRVTLSPVNSRMSHDTTVTASDNNVTKCAATHQNNHTRGVVAAIALRLFTPAGVIQLSQRLQQTESPRVNTQG